MPKTKTHKWIVTEIIAYEVEAATQKQAIEKFNSNPSAFVEVGRFCEAKSWLDGKKDDLANAIFESVGLEPAIGFCGPVGFTDDFWEELKKGMKSFGWEAGEMKSKDLEEGEEHPENQDDDHVTISLVNEACSGSLASSIDLVYWVSIPKEQAIKVLALGVPKLIPETIVP